MKPIEERIEDFRKTLEPFRWIYPEHIIEEFFEYWIELTPSGKKFRKELQKTWTLSRRLKTWKTNSDNWHARKPAITEREQRKESVDNLAELSRRILSRNRNDNSQ